MWRNSVLNLSEIEQPVERGRAIDDLANMFRYPVFQQSMLQTRDMRAGGTLCIKFGMGKYGLPMWFSHF